MKAHQWYIPLLGLLYDLCCTAVLCLGFPVFLLNKKLQQYLHSRESTNHIIRLLKDIGEKPVFLYCSSIGELEQAVPLIQRIKAYGVPHFIFVHSKNGLVHAQHLRLAYVALTPMDFFTGWHRIFKKCQPGMCIINRHECWPGFVFNALLQSRLYLINTVEKDYRNPLYAAFMRWLRLRCTGIFFVNRPKTMIETFITAGDTRLDRLRERKSAEADVVVALRSKLKEPDRKVLVIGNAYVADANMLNQVLSSYHEVWDQWQIVLIPARPAMADDIRFAVGSHLSRILIDASFGQLFSWYQCADAAWIGGGFSVGIHNTLEASISSAMLFSGPNLAQQPDAIDAASDGRLRICKNAADCIAALKACTSRSQPIKHEEVKSPTEIIFNSIFPGYSTVRP